MTSIVVVSHSHKSEGVKQLINQMTDGVDLIAVGGLSDDEIGTSFDQIVSVINGLENDALCFYDIGSAYEFRHTLEMYEGDHKIVKMEAPIVEGSFIASVGIKSNMSMDSVISEVRAKYPEE